jgi:hypothetical protein
MKAVSLGNNLKGEAFIRDEVLKPGEREELDKVFNANKVSQWRPQIVAHSFLDPLENKRFFEDRGFWITKDILLEQANHPRLINDKAIVELSKRRDL